MPRNVESRTCQEYYFLHFTFQNKCNIVNIAKIIRKGNGAILIVHRNSSSFRFHRNFVFFLFCFERRKLQGLFWFSIKGEHSRLPHSFPTTVIKERLPAKTNDLETLLYSVCMLYCV